MTVQLNSIRLFLRLIAMQLSPLDPKERYGLGGTIIRGGHLH
jgi:hypothetical protein